MNLSLLNQLRWRVYSIHVYSLTRQGSIGKLSWLYAGFFLYSMSCHVMCSLVFQCFSSGS